jgi:hypothetical protein
MTSTDPSKRRKSRRQSRFSELLLIGIAVAVVSAAVLQSRPLQSANDRSRWCTVWSLVERQTYQIDDIDRMPQWSTIDKVRYRSSEEEPWHFYSSKPPLLATLVAGLYSVERFTLGYGLFSDTEFVTRLLLFLVNVVPLLISLVVLRAVLVQLHCSAQVRFFVLAAAGFGSMLNPYYSTLNNHTPAAVCVVFCIAAAVKLWPDRDDSSPLAMCCLGFFAALASCFELPAALLGLAAFVFATRVNVRRTLTHFVPAAVIPLAAFFLTNWMATGGIKPFYMYYGTEVYEFVHEGVPSYWMHPQDLDANSESTLTYLFHCVLGHHGIVSLTPVFALTLVGWIVAMVGSMVGAAGRQIDEARSARRSSIRLLTLGGCLLTVLTLSFYLSRTQNYNYGGNSVALRWLIWLTPFWWIGMISALKHWLRNRFLAAIAFGLLFASVVSVSVSLNQPWKTSWLYNSMRSMGWIDYRSKPAAFDPPRGSVIRQIPDEGATIGQWTTASGRSLTLQVIEHPVNTTNTSDSAWLQVSRANTHGVSEPTLMVEFDRSGFEVGDDIQDWLRDVSVIAADGTLAAATERQVRDLRYLLRGLPISRAYVAQGPIWKKMRWRPELAYEIERGAAQVTVDGGSRGFLVYRCDVSYCDEVPFGVLQWKITVRDESGEALSTETWTINDK